MPETLVVQLNPTPDAQYTWVVFNEEKASTEPAAFSALDEVRRHCQHKTIIALLPPEEVLLLTVTLPLIKKNQLTQAIPFAIQEELSDKPDCYHIKVLDEQDPAGIVHVAVIEKKRLLYWHQLLSEHDIEAHYFIPSLLAARYQPNCITIMEHETTCLVRTGEYTGFVTDKENLSTLLDNYFANNLSEKIIVQRYNQATANPIEYTNAAVTLETQSLTKANYVKDLAQGSLSQLKSNLLWGKLLSQAKSEKVKVYWQITVGCLIAIIAIAMINKIIQYSVYSAQNTTLNNKIAAVYQQNFPNSTSMVAPKLRLEDKLKSLNNLATSNPYLDLLGSAGQILKDSSLLTINSMQFSNNTLSLEVTAKNFTDLNEVIHQLTAKELRVTQQNAKAQGNTVVTQLIIKEST